MTLDEAAARLRNHYCRGIAEYPPIRDRGQALERLTTYCTKASAVHNAADPADKDARFAQRIAQLGGLCLRTLVDLNITDHVPGDTGHDDAA